MDNMCIIVLEDIKFFPVSEKDIQYGYDLWKLTQKEFLENINGEWNDEFELKNYKDERIRNLENNYLIKYKKNIIGWLEYEVYNDYIFINQLHITPEYQNKGFGTKILKEYFVYGKKENKNIFLEVLQGNDRALEYYERIGFKEYDECSISKTLVYEINDTAMAQPAKEKLTFPNQSMNKDLQTLYQQGMDYINKLKPFEAAECFRKAAEQGHAEAQYNLGICYEDGDGVEWSYTEAEKWYAKAAAQGHEEAKLLLDILKEIIGE